MKNHFHKIKLDGVDLSRLEAEDDLRREAHKLLANALVQVGEAMGEVAWNELQKSFKRTPGFKLNSSPSDNRKFVREAGQNYRRQAGPKEKREVEDYIVHHLRQRKGRVGSAGD